MQSKSETSSNKDDGYYREKPKRKAHVKTGPIYVISNVKPENKLRTYITDSISELGRKPQNHASIDQDASRHKFLS